MLTSQQQTQLSSNDVTVVIVTYFSAACIKPMAEVLNSFKHVIFVDNASTDDTKECIRSLIAHATIISLSENIGFGAANNRGFQKCTTPYIAIVNPDIAFTSETLEKLLVTANTYPDAAFIAPQLIDKSGKLDISYRFPRYLNGQKLWKPQGPAAEALTCVGFASGAFLLARRQAVEALKGFDENFFLYYEDDDLCTRAFQAGMQIIVNPNAIVTHYSRGSVKTSSNLKAEYFRAKHHTYSKLLFEEKHNRRDFSKQRAVKLLKLWVFAILALPLRVVVPSKKYSAYLGRVLGRISGLIELTFNRR
jgi:N-acetylglucosaminyl-diphospho-decaprenol L-rhamnosyltransferase